MGTKWGPNGGQMGVAKEGDVVAPAKTILRDFIGRHVHGDTRMCVALGTKQYKIAQLLPAQPYRQSLAAYFQLR